MKIDDLIEADNTTVDDQEILDALTAFGFVSAIYTLYHNPTVGYVAKITALRADGSGMTWLGNGTSPQEAEADAIDTMAKWLLTQPQPGQTP